MAGDHACPVCGSRFTRPQHVTRHMRSHTGDRPYNCGECGDRFARSDLLSRHVNKCHNGQGNTVHSRGNRRNTHSATSSTSSTSAATSQIADIPCDQCIQTRQKCDLSAPCASCLYQKRTCTYATKTSRSAGTSTSVQPRRVSLPSLTQQPPQAFVYGSQPTLTQAPYAGGGQLSGLPGQGFDAHYNFGANLVPGAQPVPMPNGQFIGDDRYTFPSSAALGQSASYGQIPSAMANGIPPLENVAYGNPSPPQRQSHFPQQAAVQQPYQYGATDTSSPVPPLSSVDGYGGGDPAAYLQQRRGSLQGATGHHRAVSSSSEPYHSSPQQQYQPYSGSYPSSFQQSSPASSTKGFDPKRFGDRMAAARGSVVFDDTSSVSDFGSNSGAPSPVPSSQSVSFSSSSRPTSSAGSLHDGQGNDNFISSMQGTIPLPTPFNLSTFQTFQDGPGGSNDRTPGVNGIPGGKAYGHFPPIDQLRLDESLAAAAAASGNPAASYGSGLPYSYGVTLPPLSGGGKSALNDAGISDMWSKFVSEPLTGGNSSASHNAASGHGLTKQMSMPSLKTPLPLSSERTSILGMDLNHPTPRALYPNGHSTILGMSFGGNAKGDSDATPTNKKTEGDTKPNAVKPTTAEEQENLRSYQEACLKRETPMLRLGPRPKSRLISSTSPQSGNIHPLPSADADVRPSDKVRFAAPFAPGTKEARDWNQSRAQAAVATDLRQASSLVSGDRPSYKRLPSQTLGPDYSKRARDNNSAIEDSDGSDGDYKVSLPQPGYVSGGVSAAGGLHNSWARQRSMSSPTGTRPSSEWGVFGVPRVG